MSSKFKLEKTQQKSFFSYWHRKLAIMVHHDNTACFWRNYWRLAAGIALSVVQTAQLIVRFSERFRSGLVWRYSRHIHATCGWLCWQSTQDEGFDDWLSSLHIKISLQPKVSNITLWDQAPSSKLSLCFRNRQVSLQEICFIFKHHSGLLMTFQLADECSASCATASLTVPPFTGLSRLHTVLTQVCDLGWNLFCRWTKQISGWAHWSWTAVVSHGRPDCSWSEAAPVSQSWNDWRSFIRLHLFCYD